jgi:hypothetical protein
VLKGDKFGHGAAHWNATMSIPHYINEDRSDMRSIKPGWYAEDDDGNLSSGPFSSREECLNRSIQPTNGSTSAELRVQPK